MTTSITIQNHGPKQVHAEFVDAAGERDPTRPGVYIDAQHEAPVTLWHSNNVRITEVQPEPSAE